MPPGGLIGDANVTETDLGNGVSTFTSTPPNVETTSANGSVSLSDGSISHTNKMTTASISRNTNTSKNAIQYNTMQYKYQY